MFRDVLEQVMEVEMDDELGRERCQRSEETEGQARNYRNGHSKKTVKTQLGEVDIKVPRDRQGKYEPTIIGKYDRNAEGMEEKILALSHCQSPCLVPFIGSIHQEINGMVNRAELLQ